MKWIVIAAFAGIVLSMGSALVFMLRNKEGSGNMVKALAMRVGISVSLFLFILFSYWMGWVQPTGIPVR
jgi:uncharacterized membrane protein YdcZ (DUF606 family)